MAASFKNVIIADIGTTLTTVQTTPASTVNTLIGLSIANKAVTTINVDVTLTEGGTTVYIVKSTEIPAGTSLVLFGGDQKLIMEAGNILKIVSDTASSADVVMSYMEIPT